MVLMVFAPQFWAKLMSDLHFCCSTSRDNEGVLVEVSCNIESILEISLNLIEDVFAGSSQEDCASFGIFTLLQECKVLVTNLSYFKEATIKTNVFFSDLISSVYNSSSTSSCNSQVV